MENVITPEMQKFIEKAQCTMRELYEEFNSLDNGKLQYECSVSKLIDDGYSFSCMDLQSTISPQELENVQRTDCELDR